MKTDTVFDIKQYIADIPSSAQESCFNISRNGTVLNVYTQIGDVEGIEEDPTLDLAYAAYTDAEAKRHVAKVREVLGFSNESGVDGTLSYPVIGAGASNFYSIKDLDIPADEQVAYLEARNFTPDQLRTSLPVPELIPPPPVQLRHAVRALNLSHWNPPPANLQLKGHLFYLQVSTIEGGTLHITANSAGFYVNNTSGEKFDASPRHGKFVQSHSLLTLLKELSPKVEEILLSNAEILKNIDPHAYLKPTNTFFSSPWVTNLPTVVRPDLSKTQDSLYQNEPLVAGAKDWNEELQASRELEKTGVHARISRERLMNKLSFEFAEAASKGALGIVKGNITALNLEEPEASHIFLHNGIFYSYGVDGTGIYPEMGGDAAARYCVGKEALGVNFLNKLDIDGLYPLATAIIDYAGRRLLAQTPVPGIFRQRAEGESQISYGSIDSKTSIVADESFTPFMKAVSDASHSKTHTVFDSTGKPTELVTPSSLNGLLGTDNRKYILDLHSLTPLDLGFYEDLKDSEVKYPHSVGTLRAEAVEEWWRIKARELMSIKLAAKRAEAEKNAPPKAAKEIKKAEEAKDAEETKEVKDTEESKETNVVKEGETPEEEETVEEEEVRLTQEENQEIVIEASEKFRVNPDVPLDITTIPEGPVRDQYIEDAIVIKEISSQIKDIWIPTLLSDFKSGSVGVPFDGTQLTSMLHKRGINMRYLGYIANLSAKEGSFLEALHHLVVQEIIVRSAKHILTSILAKFPLEFAAEIVPHYFNCLLGYKINGSPEIAIDAALSSLYPSADTSLLSEITVESVRAEIASEANRRFRFALSDDWISAISPLPLFRELSIKLGLQWKGRNFDFTGAIAAEQVAAAHTSASNAPKKSKKNKKQGSAPQKQQTRPTLFSSDDIIGLVPIIKYGTFRSQMAEEALESGRGAILKGDHEIGLELLNESLTLHEHIYGLIHPETASIYSQLALVYNELKNGDMACDYGRKAILIQERCYGVDSSETMLLYLNLALFEHTNGNTAGALQLIRHAFKYWSSICSPDQPDSITTMNNVATMLQNLKLHALAVQWYKASLALTLKVYGPSSPNLAALNFQIAQSHVVLQDYNAAVESMRDSHKLFLENFGPEDSNTTETKVWLDQLVTVAVSVAKAQKNAAAAAEAEGAQNGGAGGASSIAAVAAAAASASANRKARLQHARGTATTATGTSSSEPSSIKAPKSKTTTAVLEKKSISELVDYINGTAPSTKNKSKKKAAAAASKKN